MLPSHLHRATVIPTRVATRKEMFGHAQWSRSAPADTSSIHAVLADMGETAWPLAGMDWTNVEQMAHAIQTGTAIGACDGSYMPERSKAHGATAWVLQTSPSEQCFLSGSCSTSGIPREVNAYRSELQGIHAVLLALTVICKVYNILEGKIQLACDNEQGVRYTNDKRLDVPSSVHHADLIRAIRRLRKELPIQVEMLDVDGHKDKLVPFHALSPHEKLNCQADHKAKEHLLRVLTHSPAQPVPSCIHGEGIRLWMDDIKVTGNPSNALSQQIYRYAMCKHLHNKGMLAKTDFDLVNWDAIGTALEHRSPSFCAWVTKHVSGECGVGEKMYEWGYWETSNCPCCNHPKETTKHFAHCQSEVMLAAFDRLSQSFLTWMVEADTQPDILEYFTLAMQHRACPTDSNLANALDKASQEQARIGWNNLLFGRVAKEWQTVQQEHYRQTSSRRSAERWAADVTYRLLQLSHGLWMARNRFLHERDEQGLLLAEGQSLKDAITNRFLRGRKALLPADYHLLDDRPLDKILAMPPSDKYTWLGAIRLAHQLAKDTNSSDQARMRTSMQNYIRHGTCQPTAQQRQDSTRSATTGQDETA